MIKLLRRPSFPFGQYNQIAIKPFLPFHEPPLNCSGLIWQGKNFNPRTAVLQFRLDSWGAAVRWANQWLTFDRLVSFISRSFDGSLIPEIFPEHLSDWRRTTLRWMTQPQIPDLTHVKIVQPVRKLRRPETYQRIYCRRTVVALFRTSRCAFAWDEDSGHHRLAIGRTDGHCRSAVALW